MSGTAEQEERFKWQANERADRAEAALALIYGQLVDRLWGCDADAAAVLNIVEDARADMEVPKWQMHR